MTDPSLPTWRKGDIAVMYYGNDEHVEVRVVLASPNSVSLALTFDAIVDGHVGMMPVLYEDGSYRSIINGLKVRLTSKASRLH